MATPRGEATRGQVAHLSSRVHSDPSVVFFILFRRVTKSASLRKLDAFGRVQSNDEILVAGLVLEPVRVVHLEQTHALVTGICIIHFPPTQKIFLTPAQCNDESSYQGKVLSRPTEGTIRASRGNPKGRKSPP